MNKANQKREEQLIVVNKAFIENLRENKMMNIPKDLETFLLKEYGDEPSPYEYTEQDLYEQVQKAEIKYRQGLLNKQI